MLPRPSLLLAVFAGGCVGGLTRYLVVPDGPVVPWRLVAVNAAGAFLLAFLLTGWLLPPLWRALLGTGFCGALTTFSGIVVPVVQQGAVGYLFASLVAGVAAAYGGAVLGRMRGGGVPGVVEDVPAV
jgi:CrcB protein